MKRLNKNKQGMSFVEILVSLFIVTFGIMSSLLYMTTAKAATELAQDKTIATTHAELLLEEMKARTTLASITGTNWETFWQTFVAANSVTVLPGETLAVTYTNAAADPLAITIVANWTRKSRTYSISLLTELTK